LKERLFLPELRQFVFEVVKGSLKGHEFALTVYRNSAAILQCDDLAFEPADKFADLINPSLDRPYVF
jgi:hypothetical protein